MKNLAFVGLGAMGAPMAKSLLSANFDLHVFDVREENARPLVEMGAKGAGSPREAAESAEALVLMVVNAEQAEAALFGENGAAEALAPDTAVVVMSTVGPEPIRELDGLLSERRLRLLDAPVSGGVARAEGGDLLIMAGGPEDLFDGLRPVLEAMGSTVVHCGPAAGDGQSVKLVNQLLCGVHIAAAGEALAYAEALGLDPKAVHETIRHGAAGSFMFEDRGRRMLDREFLPPRSALDIFVKDMGLVREAAGERGFATPLSDVAHRLYEEGSSLGFGGEDDSGVLRVFEEGMGPSQEA
ncbi:MAG: NAD(P)-dependent oxidoreductase [Rubrobacter sp.]|jgi:3-hydroxyisobutyrate dehydrogenase-like beta-hydroxyacid dehydrogenase|nr:NAD(P)-dependent oxidoreductase [Rubrobacter sp.]MBA3950667.1 NAD(P)-dependent oxidoreductase [Rubrobacter sp.]MDQ3360135.1 NAD(P)-dependent oxidoreductase [Actinomycetota bacterium]MDQ3375726.1 NAD(P)-dependent oxidoreductase [Actinomycetota bacterium]